MKRNLLVSAALVLSCILPSVSVAATTGTLPGSNLSVSPINVSFLNKPVVITSVVGPHSVIIGKKYTWRIMASDPEGKAVVYKTIWGDGTQTPAATSTPNYQEKGKMVHAFSSVGTYNVTFKATDGSGTVTYIKTFVRVMPK